ncbi:hypothetical protein BS333_14690 [Vibrio azureus]|uniref:Thioredoxin-like fold domain-containing protein n=1 Tax=Vibrio azureus NBRC 104587 TaxID=1219077 RepID=U3A9L9_9VIBR|nr:hypothetical protein [Vibrio azureus]AUI87652.1 hypothetical protein BS333_14690 [Vibrio azureus]GAD76641.1 hypothetical protein VAZ01S_049_00080 [Vibrio azureus NBRC 104587]
MKTFIKKLLLVSVAATSANGLAAVVELNKVTDAQSLVPQHINHTFDRITASYATATNTMVAHGEGALVGGQVTKAEVNPGLVLLQKKSIARFEYQYKLPNGKPAIRTYHSYSGDAPITKSLQGDAEAKERFRQWSEAEMRNENEVLVTGKISEQDYATMERYFKASSYAQANDAEIKALRRIEQDMNAGVITSGGELRVYVNQIPCQSCMPLFEEQLKQWDLIESATVAYLPQNRSYFGKGLSEEELSKKSAYLYVKNNGALSASEAEEGLQSAFTSHRATKTKYQNFKNELNNTASIRGEGSVVTGCGY